MKRLLRRFHPQPAVPAAGAALRSVSRTHLGRVRRLNEDRVLDRADLGLWAVADGMGGHSRGDVAADTLVAHLAALPTPVSPQAIDDALQAANRAVYQDHGGQSGTTLVMLTVEQGVATIRWAGDSRAYLIRNGRPELLTRDHSLVQELVEAGLVTPDKAATHPKANVITRALGTSPHVAVEALSLALKANDRVLLCSDGLSRSLEDRDVAERCDIEPLADRLLQNALQRDASDNISLVIVEAPAGAAP